MPNALDAFKAQREAAAAVHAELSEASSLLRQLRAQRHGDRLFFRRIWITRDAMTHWRLFVSARYKDKTAQKNEPR